MTDTPPPLTDEQLAERIAAAAHTVQLRLGPNALAMAQRGEPIRLSGGECGAVADAVLAVARPELDRLRAERDQARAQLDAANARITAVLALTIASREELEQMDPEQYHQAIGCDTAITDIQRMLAAGES